MTSSAPRAVERVAVLGAGVMGSGIAQVLATAGCETACFDIDSEALARGEEAVAHGRYGLARGVERGKLTEEAAAAARARLRFTTSLDDAVAGADLVIEAVPERIDLKIAVLRDLDRRAPRDAILASNTSGLSVTAMAAATERPGLVVGWHWASPAPVMRFAEIVRTPLTDEDALATVVALAERCGKQPVVVHDVGSAWGFVANRVYFAMVAEARRVVDEGVATPAQVDQLMVDCFGWPVGPLGMARRAGAGWT
ncbi:MAG: 3-hydroxyacyl-CoA dehydrogenase family protein [Acidimicrobiia bacterium]